MVDPELLSILVCPETKEPVRVADEELVGRVNRAIESRKLLTKGGDTVTEPLDEGGLVREDGRVLYPVRHDIPIMLVDEAFLLDGLE